MFMLIHEREQGTSDVRWLQKFGELSDRLSDRYGPPSIVTRTGPVQCEGAMLLGCVRRGEAVYRLHWGWPQRPLAGVTLVLGQAQSAGPDPILIFYRDEAGIIREYQEEKRKQENL